MCKFVMGLFYASSLKEVLLCMLYGPVAFSFQYTVIRMERKILTLAQY
jgi:hypothetical protein